MTTALCEPGLPLEGPRDGSWVAVGLVGTHTRSSLISRGESFKGTLRSPVSHQQHHMPTYVMLQQLVTGVPDYLLEDVMRQMFYHMTRLSCAIGIVCVYG